jgi:glycosyltransferase involved in cell wall biosynthesis
VRVRRFLASRLGGRYPVSVGLWAYLARHGHEYDLLHAQSYHAFPALGALLARSIPLVLTPHYHGPGHSRLGAVLHRPYKLLGLALLRRAWAVICVSQTEANILRRDFPSVASRVVVIPNGIDPPAQIPDSALHGAILAVGRLKAYKGVDRVLEALTLLPGYTLTVVGEGPALGSLKHQSAALGVADRVRFAGTVDEATLASLFAHASVEVSMSRQEAFGLTLAEALARRMPVVVSDLPAHREVLDLAGPVHARLLSPDAPATALAEEIAHAMRLGRTPALPRLPSWDDVAQRTFEVYEDVLRLRRATAGLERR